MVTLETERLVLRPFAEADLDAYQAMVNDPDVMRMHHDAQTLNRFESWRGIATYLGHWQMRGYGPFAVSEKSSGTFVGRIGPWFPEGWPGLELIWMVDRRYWGRGYAPEAAAAARDFTLERVGPGVELMSLIEADNTASVRVAQKLGARHTREVEHEGMALGVWTYLSVKTQAARKILS